MSFLTNTKKNKKQSLFNKVKKNREKSKTSSNEYSVIDNNTNLHSIKESTLEPMPQQMQNTMQEPMQYTMQNTMQQPMQQPMQYSMQQPMQYSMQQPMQYTMQNMMQEPMQSMMQSPLVQKSLMYKNKLQDMGKVGMSMLNIDNNVNRLRSTAKNITNKITDSAENTTKSVLRTMGNIAKCIAKETLLKESRGGSKRKYNKKKSK